MESQATSLLSPWASLLLRLASRYQHEREKKDKAEEMKGERGRNEGKE